MSNAIRRGGDDELKKSKRGEEGDRRQAERRFGPLPVPRQLTETPRQIGEREGGVYQLQRKGVAHVSSS
ncbi:hypothetical protein NQZ68_012124 [Dissostichus eleginoides]|nr:hypothetical protein NQZ68_012124 [Dissostichus eleginoides]